jgi:predicted DNA-binding transcriptional regulator AlpA
VKLISLEQVVDLTRLSRSSLAKKRRDGTGPAYFKIGRTIKYAAADVDEWILSRRRTSTWAANGTPAARNATFSVDAIRQISDLVLASKGRSLDACS